MRVRTPGARAGPLLAPPAAAAFVGCDAVPAAPAVTAPAAPASAAGLPPAASAATPAPPPALPAALPPVLAGCLSDT
eukprot:4294418-Prymnesium_polylepis.1